MLRFSDKVLVFLLMSLLSSCNVLFWKSANAYNGGTWMGPETFIEIRSEFKQKSSWYPLNQNALTKDYRSTLLFHKVAGDHVTSTAEIITYDGWTLNDTLFAAGTNLVAVRGKSDGYGDAARELIAITSSQPGKTAQAETLLSPAQLLLAAVPSPNAKLIAVFTTDATNENRTGRLLVDFFDYKTGAKPTMSKRTSLELQWSGVPGNPELSWEKDSSGVFLHLESSVVLIKPDGSKQTALSFPSCFWPTSSGRSISDTGMFFYRTNPDARIEIKKMEEYLKFESIKMTTNLGSIGSGCP
ncbi:MAG: hypothetical protein JNM27_01960 [Leptospirales bacterium]|nr:hypothetical protein [Leptospirales bacterium]